MEITSPTSRKRPRIEIIPLIDIMFFLLATFLMVSLSMIKNMGVEVNLPVVSTGAPVQTKDYAAISVTDRGEIFFNKERVQIDRLAEHLEALKASHQNPTLLISSDEKASFGNVVAVLDQARKAGITKTAIQTRIGRAEQTTGQ